MTKQQRQMQKIIIVSVLFTASFFCPWKVVKIALLALAYSLVGWPVIRKAFLNLKNGQLFDENFLMTIATFGAIALGDYPEAVAVMLFYQIGELFQSYAVAKSRQSVAALMSIRPDYANLKISDGSKKVSPSEVKKGDIILVYPGEKVPLDGVVVKGHSLVDTSAVTGEAVPRELVQGNDVFSGSVNISGVLEVKTSCVYKESTVSQILNLVENSLAKKAKAELFITKFARWYTPAVVAGAVLLTILPPLFTGESYSIWLYRALTFLVISCPCALVISIPLSFFGGIGAASKHGILIKGGDYLQLLADVKTVVFDKTGTLTKGSFKVSRVYGYALSEPEVLRLAAYAGVFSSHPVSVSTRQAYGKKIESEAVSECEELVGRGVSAWVEGKKVEVGNSKMMAEKGYELPEISEVGTVNYVVVDGVVSGAVVITDEIKDDAVLTISRLKKLGVKLTLMLTGDRKQIAEFVAKKIGIDKVCSELLPAQKVEKTEEFLRTEKGNLAFVGDGINDAPVLARADVGIAMGGCGTDAAVEAADVVIMTDSPLKIVTAIEIGRKTLVVVKQNVVFALGTKAIVLAMGAMGAANMWEAVFADVGVSVMAILNAMRILYYKKLS